MAVVGLVYLVIRGFILIGIDPDLMDMLKELHKWATVVVFAQFWIGTIVRGFAGMMPVSGTKPKA